MGTASAVDLQHRGMRSETGCELHDFSSDKKELLFTPHTGFQDSEPSLSAVLCGRHEEPGWPCCHRLPEFIARDGQERANGSCQGDKRGVGATRRHSRGHGPARLDGARKRATVADKVMESGKTAGHGNGRLHVLIARQAKRAGPKLEAGPQASVERSEGTMEARRGETLQGVRCTARQRDRPCFLAGDV